MSLSSDQSFTLASDDDPICALATAPGKAAIALIRVSGTQGWPLVQACLRDIVFGPARVFKRASFIDPESGEVLDDIMVVFFKGPHSFTGQDAVELFFHGGPYIVRKALSILFAQGIRAAEPGEFTRRAFVNGKLDLSRAEGIHDLIEAQSKDQWQAARVLSSGRLFDLIESLREGLLKALAYLEAQIDFPDEKETSVLDMQMVDSLLLPVAQELVRLERGYNSGKVKAGGLRVVLWGKPNVGKSTLLNKLLDFERALVSPEAGTTRDYLEEGCLIAGRLFRFIDTAGIRTEASAVEAMGIANSMKLAQEADLVLVLASSKEETQNLGSLPFANRLCLWTKKDVCPMPEPLANEGWFAISAVDPESIDLLKTKLVRFLDDKLGAFASDTTLITNERHLACIRKAQGCLERYQDLRKNEEGIFEEMLAFELQEAARHLSAIIGTISGDEILDKVFSTFCIGK